MQRFVSVREASAYYGLSETEIRRRISDGRLVAERLTRPQGTLLRVMIDTPDETPTAHQDALETRQEPPSAAGLSVALDDLRAAHAQLAETYREIADLRERVGRAEAHAADMTALAADHRTMRDVMQARSGDAFVRAKDAEARVAELERQLEQARASWRSRLLAWWSRQR